MRGLVVLLLAVFHFSPIFLGAESPLLRHAYVTTNMFFGLSGFVLMAAYGHRLDTGARRLQFVWARLRRLYPLHLFTLGLILVVPYFVYAVNWTLSWVLTGKYFGGLPAYRIDWEHVIGDLLMVHGLGYFDALHLNFPSWSLAALFSARCSLRPCPRFRDCGCLFS